MEQKLFQRQLEVDGLPGALSKTEVWIACAIPGMGRWCDLEALLEPCRHRQMKLKAKGLQEVFDCYA